MKIISGIITSMLLALGMLVVTAPAQADPATRRASRPAAPRGRAQHVHDQAVHPDAVQAADQRWRLPGRGGEHPDPQRKTGKVVRVANRHYEFRTEKYSSRRCPRASTRSATWPRPDNDRYKPCMT